MSANAIRLMIIDDSALTRQILSQELSKDRQIEAVTTATDPMTAWNKLEREQPDVIVLDLEMPRMDGLEFLRKLRGAKTIPVVVFSSFVEDGSAKALAALDLGAAAVVAKPSENCTTDVCIEKLKAAIREASESKVINTRPLPSETERNTHSNVPTAGNVPIVDKVIAIGASTGGTEAVRDLLAVLPADMPPIVVVIHMPEGFTRRYADRLNTTSALHVEEGRDGIPLKPGSVLIAPGDFHMCVQKVGLGYVVRTHKAALVNRHRPSVEMLFNSMAQHTGRNGMGIILTGMGMDGAAGLLAMRNAGCHTVAQDEESCVVFGMPKEAIRIGAANSVLSLNRIPATCVQWAKANRRA